MTPKADLPEILDYAIQQVRHAICNGIEWGAVRIPKLDPFEQLPTIQKQIEVARASLSLTISDPVLTGLSTFAVLAKPHIELGNSAARVNLSLGFTELEVISQNFSADGSYKLVLNRPIESEGRFCFQAKNTRIDLGLSISTVRGAPQVTVADSSVKIDKIETDIEDSVVLEKLVPHFRSQIETALGLRLGKLLETVVSAALVEVHQSEKPLVKKLVAICEQKRDQGLLTDEAGTPLKPRLLQGFEGVGELPLPMFWEVPKVEVELLEHITVDELLQNAKTGDVILFSGVLPSSQRIRRLTQSPFSHVALLVREPELGDGSTLVWQSTSSVHRGVLADMEPRHGIQLNDTREMIDDYLRECPGSIVVYRSLERDLPSGAEETASRENLLKLIRSIDGKAYTDDMWGLGVMGLLEVEDKEQHNYYCAGLVAQSLMDFGVLKDTFWQHQYAPRDFCSRQSSLPFTDPTARYSAEIVVDTE